LFTIGAAKEGYFSILGGFALGAVCSFVVHRFSSEEQPPQYYGSLCFVGFMVAITWIFLVANEVVGILQAFGMIFGLSDAILGLTIFAMVGKEKERKEKKKKVHWNVEAC